MNEEKIELDITTLLPGIYSDQDDCIQRLKVQLGDHEGIQHAHLNRKDSSSELCLHYDPSILSESHVQKLAERTGARITKRYRHTVIPIVGMDCSDCVVVLEHALSRVEGILRVEATFLEAELSVEYDSRIISRRAIEGRIQGLGYGVRRQGLRRWFKENSELLISLLTGFFLLLGWVGEQWLGLPSAVVQASYLLAYVTGGLPIARHALQHIIRERYFDTDLLMVLAALGAAVLGHWAEGALLLFLFSLGHALEGRAMDRARQSILALSDLRPKTARVRRSGSEIILPVETVEIGDLVLVPPGAKIPVDGIVEHGASSIDTSSITGESLPVDVKEDDQVFAGTVNGEGALEVRATRLARDSTLARVIQLVEQAQSEKSSTERLSDRIMRFLVPAILIIVLLVIIIPPLFGMPFEDSFLMAMALLVAASPCALALGTPSAILAGLARAARGGVLIKGGAQLENLGLIKAMAFDKTGTLTKGSPSVTDVIPVAPCDEKDVLRLAASVELHSAHPLAQAVVNEAHARQLDLPDAHSVQAKTSIGIQAVVAGHEVWVGRAGQDPNGQHHIPESFNDTIHELEAQGKSIIALFTGTNLTGLIAIADEVRSEARGTIESMRDLGLRQLLMLTGDNSRAAAYIADQVGLDEYEAELLPEDKLYALKVLEADQGSVGMVGDGVNDAPALAAATVGIAMGGAKTEAALETADVVLMADDLSRLPFAVGLGRKTRWIVIENLVIALGVMLGLTALILLNLAGITLAIILHEGSTLLVVFNSLRLLGHRDRKSPQLQTLSE
ncbi:MAG: cadmium-translocating P-type ATPase [Anaerolineales bacterium]|nr:cadmium-translocating P-type ATPase [Anaerolineales bacterium]